MKDLKKLFNECMEEVKSVGIKPGNIISITVNSRAKKRWGQCAKRGNTYKINISDRLLQDNLNDRAAKNTIIHEILHTVDGCFDHGSEWQYQANKINRAFPFYQIKRTNSPQELGVPNRTAKDYRYNVICESCGHVWVYDRAGKVVQNPSRFHCGCGGRLKVVCNDGSVILTAANKN